ncbi:MAG: homocysteine S-methyltransferase [Chloroflexi bacterium]|nr:homocysteine S-methyltransferase [Chloroflexota bacterium]
MNDPLGDLLERHELVILDGGLGSELRRRGCAVDGALWSAQVLLDAPALIRDLHREYFEAGADCAITATYQASVPGFMAHGLSEAQAIAVMQRAVHLAREARDAFWSSGPPPGRSRPLVVGSLGPYGAYLHDTSEYRGDYQVDDEALRAFHRPRIAALLAAGADLLACETFPLLREALVVAGLLAAEFPAATLWVAFSARDAGHTCHGEPIGDCARALAPYAQVRAIGVNCTAAPYIPGLVAALRTADVRPIVAYPNAGEVYDSAAGWRGQLSDASLCAATPAWVAAGARIIGGCCRTTPDFIRGTVARLRPPR